MLGRRRQVLETLHRGIADNSVGRVIDILLSNDLVIVDRERGPGHP